MQDERLSTAPSTRNLGAEIQPHYIQSFIDRMHICSKTFLPEDQLARLRSLCRPKTLRVYKGGGKFAGQKIYKQRLQLLQPTREALEFLNTIEGIDINYLELALDWIFQSCWEVEDAWSFLCIHFFKRHHGKQSIVMLRSKSRAELKADAAEGKQARTFAFCRDFNEAETRYTGSRKSPNQLVAYRDRLSKITRQRNCLHLEWRFRGKESLDREGLGSIADLLALNDREFWDRHLVFRELDHKKVGRHLNNRYRRTNRRGVWRDDWDDKVGRIVKRGSGFVVQNVIKRHREKMPIIMRYLRPISVEHLLPEGQ